MNTSDDPTRDESVPWITYTDIKNQEEEDRKRNEAFNVEVQKIIQQARDRILSKENIQKAIEHHECEKLRRLENPERPG